MRRSTALIITAAITLASATGCTNASQSLGQNKPAASPHVAVDAKAAALLPAQAK